MNQDGVAANQLKIFLHQRLNGIQAGSSVSEGGCSGNVPTTRAQYCVK